MSEPTLHGAQDIVDFILERVGQMSRRPHMYGGSAEGVDLCYGNYLELWAFATNNLDRLEAAQMQAYEDADCGAMGFAGCYFHHNEGASDKSAIKFVVKQWLEIAEKLAVPVPWRAIDMDLEELRDYIQNWWATD